MKANFQALQSPHVRFLSEDQLHEIHLASLEILERVGVKVDDPEGRQLLKDAGAWVDEDTKTCRIPSHLVKRALQTAPPRVVLADRDGKRCLFLEKNRPYFGTGSDLPFTRDPYTGERRDTTKKDIKNTSRVVDALDNIDFMMSMGIATDTPETVSDLHQFEAMVTSTKKPIVATAHHRQGLMDIVEMASMVRGGLDKLQENPLFVCYSEPVSPLRHTLEGTQKLLACAEHLIPINYTPGMAAGATGPVTRAGAIATANAELLSGLTMHQLKRPGAPFIYGGVATIMDMSTSLMPYGAPEWHVTSMVLTQLSHKYELPVFSTGGASDSLIFDQQATLEAAYSLLMAGLSGANLIHDVGYIEAGLTCSYEMLVVCDEIIDMVRHILKSFEINTETLAVDVVEQVGPGGQFVSHDHTFRNFKKEMWFPKLITRQRYEDWETTGSLTMGDRANAKARSLLENHQVDDLPGDVLDEMKDLIARRTEQYRKR